MNHNRTIGRLGCTIVLIAALVGCGLGCQPTPSGTGRTTTPTKPSKPQENKDQPGKQPKPEVG